MRPTMLLVFLLSFVVALLVDKSQGIRLDDSFVFEKIVHKESFEGGKEAAVGASCKGGGVCSGKSRKLMADAVTTSENERSKERDMDHHHVKEAVGKKKSREDFDVEPPMTYPDILDIAGMDYSPAKRKPPIHN